jgi:transcriptional regulator with XRE-family HTH domain
MNNDSNRQKLRAIVQAFEIPVSEVARVVGVSRPMVARVLSESDSYCGSTAFWVSIERNLGAIIETRKCQVFEIPAQGINQVLAINNIARQ